MHTTEIIALAASIVVLAGFSVAIVNGGNTALVIGAAGKAFTDSLAVATRGGKGGGGGGGRLGR